MPDPRARLTEALADRYRIEREIGQGGMAVVYLAHDIRHDRKVAVKVLRPELAAAMGPERFVREIHVAARLTHPHILPLHDSGEAQGFLYYVMPFVDGESLRQKLARERELPVAEAVRILREVVDALAKAHQEGVVHRDIKPDNVLLADRHALVTDFGVAKAVSEATGRQALTTAGVALGTPAYMAPEQAAADTNIDHRADIYAVGAMAYEMLTGTPPFSGTTQQAILAAHVTQPPEPITQRRETIPAPLAELVMRCLAKRASDRWQSAADMLPVLEAMATPSGGITPTETRPVAGVSRPMPSWAKPAAGLAAGIAVVAVALGLVLRGGSATPVDEDLIAVFPFAVTGGPEVQYLGEGMVNLFESNLSAGEGLRALAAQRSVQAWHDAGGASAPEDRLRQAARGLGAGLVLQGNLVASGQNLVINASLAGSAGSELNRATLSGPLDGVATLVGRLTAQLLSLHAGEYSDRTAALADVPLQALQAYLEGQSAYRVGRFEESLELFGRALEIDSTFALAALSHSTARGWVLTAPPSPGVRLAYASRHKLSERDQALLEAIRPNYPDPTNYIERIAAAERATRLMPDRVEAWYFLGDRIFHYGQLVGMRPEEITQQTWAAFDRGLAIDPDFGAIVTHKFDQAWWDEDWTRLEALRDSHPAMAAARWDGDLAAAIRRGDSSEVRRLMGQVDQQSHDRLSLAAMFASFVGGFDEARTLTEAALRRATTVTERLQALERERARQWAAGRPTDAAAVTERILREARGPRPPDAEVIRAGLFYGGDSAQADETARALARYLSEGGLEPGGPVPNSWNAARRSDLCDLGLWWAAQSQLAQASAVARQFERAAQSPDEYEALASMVCGLMLRAVVAQGAEQRRLVERLDSIGATGPDIGAVNRSRLSLVLGRLFSSLGEHRRAMEAALRTDQFDPTGQFTLLGDAGRYALAAGDSAIAVWSLNWYLPTRAEAEPHLRARDDELREGLARLLGEPSR